MIDIAPDWVYTSKNSDGLTINNYFIENPDMILGKVVEGNKLYGKGTMVVPFENSDLKVILNEAVKKIKGNYTAENASVNCLIYSLRVTRTKLLFQNVQN